MGPGPQNKRGPRGPTRAKALGPQLGPGPKNKRGPRGRGPRGPNLGDYSVLWDYFMIIQEVDYPRTPYSSLEMVGGDYMIIWRII